ncbi:MAG: ABC transporter ATP-binding protein [Corynebacterium sp.]|nr:ABC transporter ATP-binding protein [Corynebacterium sp.]
MIIVENLSKKYGSKLAVDNLSFTIPDGQVTGFLGPNGSGKSTSMRCMLGLDAPTQGTAVFRGEGYNNQFAKLRNKAAVAGAILDSGWFNRSRSGRNHLRVIAQGAGIPTSRVEECLDLVGMTDVGNQKLGGYSLGMKQRIGVAAALLGDPQHLILDEPVNGLDPEGVSWMRNTIRSLAAAGKAIMVSSHLLAEMEQTADRLIVIGRGQMIGEYSMSEFLADGTTVEVETPQADALQAQLVERGLTVVRHTTNAMVAQGVEALRVPVEKNQNDQQLRTMIAEIAMYNSILVVGMSTHRENLEQRFLAATREAQEYHTSGAVPYQGPPPQQLQPPQNPFQNPPPPRNPGPYAQ